MVSLYQIGKRLATTCKKVFTPRIREGNRIDRLERMTKLTLIDK